MKETNSSEEFDNIHFLTHKDWKEDRLKSLRSDIASKTKSRSEKNNNDTQKKGLLHIADDLQNSVIDTGSFVTGSEWKQIHNNTSIEITDDVLESEELNDVKNDIGETGKQEEQGEVEHVELIQTEAENLCDVDSVEPIQTESENSPQGEQEESITIPAEWLVDEEPEDQQQEYEEPSESFSEVLPATKQKQVQDGSTVFTIKTTKKAILLNIAVVIICLTGAFYFLKAYYNAINASFVKLDEEPIATIVYKYKIAQRKMDDRVAWDRLKQNTPVYNGDLIRTAELSEANITFVDGSSIDLHGQSLTQIFYDENGAVIDFSGGNISVNTINSVSGMRLIAGKTEVTIEQGAALDASAQTTHENGVPTFEDAPVTLQLNEGEAKILVDSNGEQEQIAVDSGSALVLDPTTSVVEVSELTLLSPATQLTYIKYENEALSIPFEWVLQNSESEFSAIFEVSPFKDFSEVTQSYSFEDITTASIPFESGAWYWRLFVIDSEINLSGKVNVLDTYEPSQITPSEGSEYSYRTKTPAIRFVWEEDDIVTGWLFEVADNEAMQNPVESQQVNNSSAILNTLEDGMWYWRITPQYSSRHILSDSVQNYVPKVQSFSVIQQSELLPVELLSPAMHSFVNTQQADTPQFVWKYDREASFYTFTISSNADLSNPVITEQVTDTFFTLGNYVNEITDGLWYWAVTKSDSEGNISPVGEVGEFYAISGEPVYEIAIPENAEVFTEQTIQETQFAWHNNLPFKTVLQISSDSSFTNVYYEQELNTANVQGFVTNLVIPLGSWYWRTISQNEETGNEYITDVKQFFIDFTLENVLLTSPSANATLKTHDDYRQTFRWQSVEHVDYYTFALYSQNNLETPIFERRELTTTELRIDVSNYADGQYEWRVKAVSSKSPSGRIQETDVAVRTFTINAIKPITLSGLSRTVQFDGVSALLNPQSASWASNETIVSSEFILSKTNNGLRASDRENGITPIESDIVMRVENPTRSVELIPLNEGTYYWTVLARTTGGIDISAVEPRVITVHPLSLLPSVTDMIPLQNSVLQNNDILKGFIDFSWSAVEHADEYHFAIIDQNNTVLWEQIVTDNTNIHFEDIALLDRGTFTWTVVAKRYLPNNTVQNGTIAEHSFTIDIGQPVVPQDRTMRGQYGF